MAGDGFAVNAFRFFCEKLDEGRTIGNLTAGFCKRFSLLSGQDQRQIFGVFHHQIVPFAQDHTALFSCARGPLFLRHLGGGNGLGGLRAAKIGDLSDDIAARRIGHIKGIARCAIYPVTRQIALGGQKVRIFQQTRQVCHFIQHVQLLKNRSTSPKHLCKLF